MVGSGGPSGSQHAPPRCEPPADLDANPGGLIDANN